MKTWIQFAGVLHFVILIASALTPRVLDWRKNLAPLHPFLRTLFWVYGAFIVLAIVAFGVLTLAFADRLVAGDAFARAFATFAGVWWLARLLVQLFVFDTRPFLTRRLFAVGYHCLTAAFMYLTTIYGWVALRP